MLLSCWARHSYPGFDGAWYIHNGNHEEVKGQWSCEVAERY